MPRLSAPSPPGSVEGPTPAPPRRRSAAGMAMRALLGLAAGLLVAGVAGFWLGVKPGEVLAYVGGVPLWAVLFCVGSSFVVLAFQALRWYEVMGPLLHLRYADAYRAQ